MHKRAWNCQEVRDWRDVLEESKLERRFARFGRIHGLCVENNHEVPFDRPGREYVGRIVFSHAGVAYRDAYKKTPADAGKIQLAFEGGRIVDCYGACTGHASENAMAIQICS